jgi:hypothetical protein
MDLNNKEEGNIMALELEKTSEGTPYIGTDENGDGKIDTIPVKINGSLMERFGATVASRPLASAVPVGCFYMAVNTGDVWQSNGTDWVVR